MPEAPYLGAYVLGAVAFLIGVLGYWFSTSIFRDLPRTYQD